jgi:hypothetical protein
MRYFKTVLFSCISKGNKARKSHLYMPVAAEQLLFLEGGLITSIKCPNLKFPPEMLPMGKGRGQDKITLT